MHIVCNNDTNEGGIQVWSQVKVPSLFVDYRIQSNASNEISLALSSEALLAALRSAAASVSTTSTSASNSALSAEEITMKLAKKNDVAVLSFEITGMSRMQKRIRVGHDVRIEVLKPADVAKMHEPLCPEPDVSSTHALPSCRFLNKTLGARTYFIPSEAADHRRAPSFNV